MPDAPQSDWRDSGKEPCATWRRTPLAAGGAGARFRQTWPAHPQTLLRSAPCSPSPSPSARPFSFGSARFKPACLVLIGSGYEQNLLLPHNVYGWNGLATLEKEVTQDAEYGDVLRLPWDQPTQMRCVGSPIEPKEETWKEIWNKIDVGSYKEKNVVAFISLHGIADKDEAYLLPNLPARRSPRAFQQSRIPFRDLLDSVKGVKKKNVVLLLDVCHADADWPIGMLHNDFVKRLQEKYEAEIAGMGNLVVICATSPDQRSWASEELQKTIFAHYVTQGLKGAGQGENRVTAWQLFKYVEEKVDKSAQANRARRQTPILLGNPVLAKEIDLVHVAEPYAEPEPPALNLDAASLKREWGKWLELRRGPGPARLRPTSVAALSGHAAPLRTARPRRRSDRQVGRHAEKSRQAARRHRRQPAGRSVCASGEQPAHAAGARVSPRRRSRRGGVARRPAQGGQR